MKKLEIENYNIVEMDSNDIKKTDGGFDPITFWTVTAVVCALVMLADYAAKEIQTGAEIYNKTHKH